jgi:hypothetical protein
MTLCPSTHTDLGPSYKHIYSSDYKFLHISETGYILIGGNTENKHFQ